MTYPARSLGGDGEEGPGTHLGYEMQLNGLRFKDLRAIQRRSEGVAFVQIHGFPPVIVHCLALSRT